MAPGATETILLRLSANQQSDPFAEAASIFKDRIAESDALYAALAKGGLTEDEARVQRRQALAGLIWSKQVYNFDADEWLGRGSSGSAPARGSQAGATVSGDTITAAKSSRCRISGSIRGTPPGTYFHCIAFGLIDPGFAKDQLC